jgi:hypothetical protein
MFFALLAIVASFGAAGCAGETSDEGADSVTTEHGVTSRTPGESSRVESSGVALAYPLERRGYIGPEGQGPQPQPWLDREGPQPQPWTEKTDQDSKSGGSGPKP